MRRGFTLIELTWVLAAIGVMAMMWLPALARSRETARRTSCAANLQQMGMAFHMYAQEHERTFPWSGGHQNGDFLLDLMGQYLAKPATLNCPSDAYASPRDFYDDEGVLQWPPATTLFAYGSLRSSYDFLFAYTQEPLHLPHPSRPMPVGVPIAWDIGGGASADLLNARNAIVDQALAEEGLDEADREAILLIRDSFCSSCSNHVPAGGMVLWLDGSISFEQRKQWRNVNQPHHVPESTDTLSLNWPTISERHNYGQQPAEPTPPITMPDALRRALESQVSPAS